MRGLARAGSGDEALHQYEACGRALEVELGAEQNAATQALYADIRQGRLLPATRSLRPSEPGPSRDEATQHLQARPPAGLVARGDELGQLHRHLEAALAGETSVAFVSGDAGSGKTALLEAFASSAMTEYPD